MPVHTLIELRNISAALLGVLREAYGAAQSGEVGERLREMLRYAHDLVDLANERLAADPQAGEHARGLAFHMAEQLAAVEGLLAPFARQAT